MDYSFLQCGEGALTVHLGDGIDPQSIAGSLPCKDHWQRPACVELQT